MTRGRRINILPKLITCFIGAIIITSDVVASCGSNESERTQITPPASGEVVYPRLVPKASEAARKPLVSFSTFDPETESHLDAVVILLTFDGITHTLKLSLNKELLDKGLKTRVSGRTVIKKQENCFYQGVCVSANHAVEDSYITVSTCNGLRGVIHLKGETYIIHPLNADAPGNGHCWPHLLSKAAPPHATHSCAVSTGDGGGEAGAQWMPFEDLHSSEYFEKVHRSYSHTDVKGEDEKHVVLAIMVDSAFFHAKNTSEDGIVDYLLSMVNAADLFYRPIGVRIALGFYQIWRHKDDMTITESPRETLQNFLLHVQGKMKDYSLSALITGQPFSNGHYGLAVPDSICSQRATAVAYAGDIDRPHTMATIMAHLIGHVLGMLHDGHGCTCGYNIDCIMKGHIFSLSGAARKFSTCSAARVETLSRSELGSCLLRKSEQSTYPQFCGNGVIERGEQCDCGPPGKCEQVDPCCDAATCMFKPWATCRTGLCCENCKPKSAAVMCRTAENDCDVPEYCDGASGECPSNLIIQDGQPCADGAAYCFRGLCPTRQSQCQLYWGPEARAAADQCYNANNVRGNAYGHCGEVGMGGRDGYYKKCETKDVFCGLLQCAGGDEQPRQERLKARITRVGGGTDDRRECKTLSSNVALPGGGASSSAGLIEDGSRCNDHRMCLSQVCVHVDSLSTHHCPVSGEANKTCSGNGRCTNNAICFCNSGYTSADCSVKLNVTVPDLPLAVLPSGGSEMSADGRSSDSEVGAPSLDVKWLVALALSLAAVTVGITLTTIFCLRRRRETQKKRASPQAVANSSGVHNGFGLTPFYGSDEASKKHRRSSFRQSSSSNDESDETDADATVPVLVSSSGGEGEGGIKIPAELLRQPERGILKKTLSRIHEQEELLSSETCSCSDSNDDDDSDSWSGCGEREGPPLVYSLPRQHEDGGGGLTITIGSMHVASDAVVHIAPPIEYREQQLRRGELAAMQIATSSGSNEDSGNATEASPGSYDDPVPGVDAVRDYSLSSRSAADNAAKTPLLDHRGTADGGCAAEVGDERRWGSAASMTAGPIYFARGPSDSTQHNVPTTTSTLDGRCRAGSERSHAMRPGACTMPCGGTAELIGLSPGRMPAHGRDDFTKQPSLKTFMPAARAASTDGSDAASRTCASRPKLGPQLTFPSSRKINRGGSSEVKQRPLVLDLARLPDCADV